MVLKEATNYGCILPSKHGRRKGGQDGSKPTLDFKNFSKKRLFFQFRGVKTNFTTFGPSWKTFGKIP